MTRVTRALEIRATPSKVWRYFASQEGLRRWISPNLEIDLKVGGRFRFSGPDEKTWISGYVLEIVPESWLILSWMEEGQGWQNPTRLVLALEASRTGTRATMTFDGFAGIGRADWPDMVADYERGSDEHKTLQTLAKLAESE
ncbi:MAG TPA: SRPBCC domain-containing protein [Rhizomicrobium sp.]